MWPIIILGIAAIVYGAIELGFVPPPHASVLLYFRSGRLRVARGKIRPHANEHVTDILNEAGVAKAFIAITPGNRVKFSRSIPESVRQRLRNVLLNQWV